MCKQYVDLDGKINDFAIILLENATMHNVHQFIIH